MAPVGRWQKGECASAGMTKTKSKITGKDLTWFAKGSKDDKAAAQAAEVARIKEAEAEAMAVAL